MKMFFLVFVLFIMSFPVMAGPVESASCTQGGEFGNLIVITFLKDIELGKLVIKRQKEDANYVRDLTNFKGGEYRLDIAPQGGVTGYTIEYKDSTSSDYQSHSDSLNCAVATVDTIPVVAPTAEPITEPTTPNAMEIGENELTSSRPPAVALAKEGTHELTQGESGQLRQRPDEMTASDVVVVDEDVVEAEESEQTEQEKYNF
ncbi:MAG: hypothetical protein ACD_62C00207G0002 [uncultured bacterium]|nr:MAG: hypothetical protein ACD_62C00207G0002 [uncultured bacterium]HLD45240.1 hypothetical protein [bacterium]